MDKSSIHAINYEKNSKYWLSNYMFLSDKLNSCHLGNRLDYMDEWFFLYCYKSIFVQSVFPFSSFCSQNLRIMYCYYLFCSKEFKSYRKTRYSISRLDKTLVLWNGIKKKVEIIFLFHQRYIGKNNRFT